MGDRSAMVLRWVQLMIGTALLAGMAYVGHLITDGHDHIIELNGRVEAIDAKLDDYKAELKDHEFRLRDLEHEARSLPLPQ